MSHNVKCHTCGRGPDVPRRISTHNDLAVGYRAGQADGRERADGLLLRIVSVLTSPEMLFGHDAAMRELHSAIFTARAYLREKGLLK